MAMLVTAVLLQLLWAGLRPQHQIPVHGGQSAEAVAELVRHHLRPILSTDTLEVAEDYVTSRACASLDTPPHNDIRWQLLLILAVLCARSMTARAAKCSRTPGATSLA